MSNLDNQPRRDDRTGFGNQPLGDRTGLENRKTGMSTGMITAIVAAVVIAGALMLFGPWNHTGTAVSNTTPATSNSTTGTTTGAGAPRVITPNVPPAAPTTTTPAPATNR